MLADAPFMGFVPVRDTTVARAFYEGILGLGVIESTPFAVVVNANGTLLRLTPIPEFVVQPFTIAGWEVPDVAVAVRSLLERGVRCIQYDGMEQDGLGIWVAPDGDRIAWFNDPDGNTLSLATFAAT